MNKNNSALRVSRRDQPPVNVTSSRISRCGRQTTMTLEDAPIIGPTFDRRTVAILVSHSDPQGQLSDLAVTAVACSRHGTEITLLDDILTALPADARPGAVADPGAFWRTMLDGALRSVDLLIAHGAWQQRQRVDAFHDGFRRLRWGCSREQVDWRKFSFSSECVAEVDADLDLLSLHGRAIDECRLLLDILILPDGYSGKPALERLLASVDVETVRLFIGDVAAIHMPALMRRGYRWSPGLGGSPVGFFVDVEEHAADDERHFLARLLGQSKSNVTERRLSPGERYRMP